MLFRQFWMEWKLYTRDRGAMFWTFAFPVLMLLGFGVIFRDSQGPQIRLVRIQPTQAGAFEDGFLKALEEQHLKVEALPPDRAEQEWKEGKVAVLLEGTEPDWRLRVNAYLAPQGMPGMGLVQQAYLVAQARALGQGEPRRIPFTVESPGRVKAPSYAAFLLPGLVGLNLLSMGLFAVGMVNVAYREKGKFRRLAVTPLPKWVFLLAQVLNRFLIAGLATTVLLVAGRYIFGIQNQGSVLAFALVVGLGAAVFMAMGFALSGFAETTEVYGAISNIAFFPLMLLSGVYFTLDAAPKWLQQAVQFFPLAPFLRALRGIFNDGASLLAYGPQMAILAAWGLLAFALALRRFRWT
ncbi:MAG: ABC transporter permease [Acidobacteria bacterium]|nr:ABC transporter permease [Acidobacteriota bacterium]